MCMRQVNCILPGPFLTAMTLKNFDEEKRAFFAAKVPLKRWGDPRELLGPLLMFASDAGAFCNGASLVVDGGTTSRAY